MLQSKIGRNFLVCFLALNALLIGPFVYALLKRPDLLSAALPGSFGANASPDLSGNMLFLALLLLLNALLALVFGIGGTWHALWAGLRISPRKLRWFLHDRVGLASDMSGVVATAVQEEEKAEIAYLGRARGLLTVGLVLLALALPALCIAYTRAAPDRSPIFESAGPTIANDTVSPDTVLRFTVDQLAGGLLLDVPEIFHLRATPVETNGANLLLGLVVLAYRSLIGFGVLLLVVGMRRSSALRAYAMETPLAAAEIVAMEPMFQDGHGYESHHHDAPDASAYASYHQEDRHRPDAHEEHREQVHGSGHNEHEQADIHHEQMSRDEGGDHDIDNAEPAHQMAEEPHRHDHGQSDRGHDQHEDRHEERDEVPVLDRHAYADAGGAAEERHVDGEDRAGVAIAADESAPAREPESG